MTRCVLCRLETVLDDAVLQHDATTCVCLRCYARRTNIARPMPKALRRALTAVINAVEAAPPAAVEAQGRF